MEIPPPRGEVSAGLLNHRYNILTGGCVCAAGCQILIHIQERDTRAGSDGDQISLARQILTRPVELVLHSVLVFDSDGVK